MKTFRITILVLIIITAFAGLAEARRGHGKGRTQGKNMGRCNQTALADLPREDLNDFEKESLVLMREEEKLARDVYRALGRKHDLPVFTNIPRSEQRHMDQLGLLLERYGLEDPISGNEPGKFSNPEMQKLHDQLVAEGSKGQVQALTVGATIEDLDIHDLQQALDGDVDNQDIRLVYENLARGSRNHMRAFVGRLQAQGENYEAQHIAQADLETILAGNRERGGDDTRMARQGKGRGQGKGRSKGHCQSQQQKRGNGNGCRQDCTPRHNCSYAR